MISNKQTFSRFTSHATSRFIVASFTLTSLNHGLRLAGHEQEPVGRCGVYSIMAYGEAVNAMKMRGYVVRGESVADMPAVTRGMTKGRLRRLLRGMALRQPMETAGPTFLARDSIYAIARYMPSPVRLSVCHTGG